MRDFSGPVDKKTAKKLVKKFKMEIPHMSLLDAFTIQAILNGVERRRKESEEAKDE